MLTPDFIKSEWTEFENIMTQTLDPSNRSLRLIPLLKCDCTKPLRLRMLTHIDFREGEDQDLAWKQLFEALGKPQDARVHKKPTRGDWLLAHPYAMPEHFTGRVEERAMLSRWLNEDRQHRVLSLRALGGFGKSALSWYWLMHDVDPVKWPRVVWWSLYATNTSFEQFLIETLEYLSGKNVESPVASGETVDLIVKELQKPGTLLVLDGFERALRAFGGMNAAYQGDDEHKDVGGKADDGSERDCISLLAETFLTRLASLPDIQSKSLLTTRLTPTVLEAKDRGFLHGCDEEELKQMAPDDAVAYFRALEIVGTDAEIKTACDRYGFHPLSLCLLAGLISQDLHKPRDIAIAEELDVMGDLKQRKHHVLEAAYNRLTSGRGALLSLVACFRSAMEYDAIKVVSDEGSKSAKSLDEDLKDLVSRGLLHRDDRTGRFDLHPVVRRYAYGRLDENDRVAAHEQLRYYFVSVLYSETVVRTKKVERIEDLNPVIELYHHTVRTNRLDEAFILFRRWISDATLFQFGACELRIEMLNALFADRQNRFLRLENELEKGCALNELAISYSHFGQPRRAVSALEEALAIAKKYNQLENLGTGLANLGELQCELGELRSAESNLRNSIDQCVDSIHPVHRGVRCGELARVLAYRGNYLESQNVEGLAVDLLSELEKNASLTTEWADRCLRQFLMYRERSSYGTVNFSTAIDSARQALVLAKKWHAEKTRPNSRYYCRAYWMLGAAQCFAGEFGDSETNLNEALTRCRGMNLVKFEANILIDLARLRRATGDPTEAWRLTDEALRITERCGYVLQEADARLELAKLDRDAGEKEAAIEHARAARELARCDGPPDYTYKAAYVEAGRLLEELGVGVED